MCNMATATAVVLHRFTFVHCMNNIGCKFSSWGFFFVHLRQKKNPEENFLFPPKKKKPNPCNLTLIKFQKTV